MKKRKHEKEQIENPKPKSQTKDQNVFQSAQLERVHNIFGFKFRIPFQWHVKRCMKLTNTQQQQLNIENNSQTESLQSADKYKLMLLAVSC